MIVGFSVKRATGIFLAGDILKLTFADNASCLAKERCIPEIDDFDIMYLRKVLNKMEMGHEMYRAGSGQGRVTGSCK